MHNATTIARARAIDEAMDLQLIAMRRIMADVDEAKDYRELAVLGANLENIAHRCQERDEAENRDHAEMRTIAHKICTILEGLDNEVGAKRGALREPALLTTK